MSKGAMCKSVKAKIRGKVVFIKLENCKFDKGFEKSKNNSITSKNFIVIA